MAVVKKLTEASCRLDQDDKVITEKAYLHSDELK